MVGAHIDKTCVASEVVNAVGEGARTFWAGEVVTLNFDGLLRTKPLLAGIVVVANQFLLLRVYRNNGRALRKAFLHCGIDVPKLRIAVRVVRAFFGLAIALQAVVQIVKNLGDLHMADRVLVPAELLRNRPRAFTDPTQC